MISLCALIAYKDRAQQTDVEIYVEQGEGYIVPKRKYIGPNKGHIVEHAKKKKKQYIGAPRMDISDPRRDAERNGAP